MITFNAKYNPCDVPMYLYRILYWLKKVFYSIPGGLKLWECTYDLATYLDSSQLSGKSVLDLGCGIGLLGILALRMNAETVHFQDYVCV